MLKRSQYQPIADLLRITLATDKNNLDTQSNKEKVIETITKITKDITLENKPELIQILSLTEVGPMIPTEALIIISALLDFFIKND
jgi:type III secretion system FlhB-like substrate exporter